MSECNRVSVLGLQAVSAQGILSVVPIPVLKELAGVRDGFYPSILRPIVMNGAPRTASQLDHRPNCIVLN